VPPSRGVARPRGRDARGPVRAGRVEAAGEAEPEEEREAGKEDHDADGDRDDQRDEGGVVGDGGAHRQAGQQVGALGRDPAAEQSGHGDRGGEPGDLVAARPDEADAGEARDGGDDHGGQAEAAREAPVERGYVVVGDAERHEGKDAGYHGGR
jgi:hypothetical protein